MTLWVLLHCEELVGVFTEREKVDEAIAVLKLSRDAVDIEVVEADIYTEAYRA